MAFKFLNFTLALTTLVTKPRRQIVAISAAIVLMIANFFREGVSILANNWQDIVAGMVNANIPLVDKICLIAFGVACICLTIHHMNMFKLLVIHDWERFQKKPRV